ncbi:peroxisomal sarcosine oxidase-like isoform X1 [Haliotis cracherodii]|uniref:peroxisomal sarcosine oxidase-like isoform X1 n=1 Tax=Haliotis cracherodii TaxID=6455 RepID=UPI0039EA8461
MSDEIYDVVVVGAGVEGSAAAYYLAKRGKKTLLLEQFPLPHSRGSSHGQSRITRKAYSQDFYTEMMHEATDIWRQLEREAGWEVFRQTGFIAIGQYKGDFLEDNISSLKRNNAQFEYLTPVDFRRRYPMLRYPNDFSCVADPDGGILRADKALMAYQTMFKTFGGRLIDGAMVTNIKRGNIVTLETPNATYRGRSVIICPGPWASQILRPFGVKLPLKTLRISVMYWKERDNGSHASSKLLPFYEKAVRRCRGYDVYGLPNEEYPGHVKICLHSGPDIDTELRDQADDKWVIDLMKGYVREHFPSLEPSPSIVETCIYTNTPDEHPVLDYIPGNRNIVVGVGFSGHGFKLSPVVGKVLGQLACGETPSYSLTPFRIDRFPPQAGL